MCHVIPFQFIFWPPTSSCATHGSWQLSTIPLSVHQNNTKYGWCSIQNNQTLIRSPIEVMDNYNFCMCVCLFVCLLMPCGVFMVSSEFRLFLFYGPFTCPHLHTEFFVAFRRGPLTNLSSCTNNTIYSHWYDTHVYDTFDITTHFCATKLFSSKSLFYTTKTLDNKTFIIFVLSY